MILRCFRRECVVFLFSLFEKCLRWYFVLSLLRLSGSITSFCFSQDSSLSGASISS